MYRRPMMRRSRYPRRSGGRMVSRRGPIRKFPTFKRKTNFKKRSRTAGPTTMKSLLKTSEYAAPRRMVRVKRAMQNKKTLAINRSLVANQMIRYTRFYIRSLGRQLSNPIYLTAGNYRPLSCTVTALGTNISGTDLSTTFTKSLPGFINNIHMVHFTPQWPGSTMGPFTHSYLGDASVTLSLPPFFGVIGPYSTATADGANVNLIQNQLCTADNRNYCEGGNATPQGDYFLEKNWNRVRVLTSNITINFFNMNAYNEMYAHVLVYKFRDNETAQPTSTGANDVPTYPCTPLYNIISQYETVQRPGINMLYDVNTDAGYMNSGPGFPAVPTTINLIRAKNCNSNGVLYSSMINGTSKSFPGKTIKVLSHKRIKLGKLNTFTAQDTGPNSTQTVKMSFGTKVWSRTDCVAADKPLDGSVLAEQYDKCLQVALYVTVVDPMNSNQPTSTDTIPSTYNCHYNIKKVLAWREL